MWFVKEADVCHAKIQFHTMCAVGNCVGVVCVVCLFATELCWYADIMGVSWLCGRDMIRCEGWMMISEKLHVTNENWNISKEICEIGCKKKMKILNIEN